MSQSPNNNPFVLKYDFKRKKYIKFDLALDAPFEISKEEYNRLKEQLAAKEKSTQPNTETNENNPE